MPTILLVDDDEDIRFLHELVLKTAGFETRSADGGQRALDMLREGLRADLIVLDVQMADMDGWDVLQAVRQDPATADVPVIMCTVKGSVQDLARGWRLGCDGYVLKPFNIHDLTATISGVLKSSKDERLTARARALAEVEELSRLS